MAPLRYRLVDIQELACETMTVEATKKPRGRLKIMVVVLGAAIALVSAVLNGIYTANLNARIAETNTKIAHTESAIADRRQVYEQANENRARSETYRNLLHIHSSTANRVDERTLESFRNTLLDTLVYGHEAATGQKPDQERHEEFTLWVQNIGNQEYEISRQVADPTHQYVPKFPESGSIDAGNFIRTRSEHIYGFWEAIMKLDAENARLSETKIRLEGDRSLFNNLAFSLQILGLFVVLTKELL